MYFCNKCKFSSNLTHNYEQHCLTKKHILLLNKKDEESYFCSTCNKEYKYQKGFESHKKKCKNLSNQINNKLNINNSIEELKKEYENKLKIEKLKNKIKKIENKNLQLQLNNISQPTNKIKVEINNITISKVQYLNNNFGNVIDIHTFIENYKTKFGLSNEQALILLENYQQNGINSCITSLVYYLKESAIKQYKAINGQDIARCDIILPFILSDKSLREHFEKSINGKWDKTTMIDNIKKIVTITNDQIFKHHNQFIHITDHQNRRLMNGILKASCYSILSNITNPELYKITSENGKQSNNVLVREEDESNNVLVEEEDEANNENDNNENDNNENNNNENNYDSNIDEYNSDDDM
jgi:hypothetical protein